VSLSSKAFQLLELLLDRRPEAVTKAEILERLWPDTFVSDASLHNLVTEIRGAVGDTPRVARYIRTVPRYGYAFQAEARVFTTEQASRPSVAGPRLVSRRREWPLVEGANLIGRDHDCLVRIDSATLSRRHARLIVAGAGTTLEDLGSKNGTLVNGRRVTEAVALNDNDEVQVGAVTLRYRLLGMLPSTLTRHDTPSR
jgi:pSer/pThr/pTyr-binding forkhead associated (FHA) protein